MLVIYTRGLIRLLILNFFLVIFQLTWLFLRTIVNWLNFRFFEFWFWFWQLFSIIFLLLIGFVALYIATFRLVIIVFLGIGNNCVYFWLVVFLILIQRFTYLFRLGIPILHFLRVPSTLFYFHFLILYLLITFFLIFSLFFIFWLLYLLVLILKIQFFLRILFFIFHIKLLLFSRASLTLLLLLQLFYFLLFILLKCLLLILLLRLKLILLLVFIVLILLILLILVLIIIV